MTMPHDLPDAVDRSIVTSRILGAPRALVFAAFSDPAHMAHWWGPNGFSTTTDRMDFRVGGDWLYTMHGPDGTDYPNYVAYTEIVAPERIVYTHGTRPDAPFLFRAFITLEELGPRSTRVTLALICDTAEIRDMLVEKYGAKQGGVENLARLEGHLAVQQLGADALDRAVAVTRVVKAPRAVVFASLGDPDLLTHWWGPDGFRTTTTRLDFRPGGDWVLTMHGPDGMDYPNYSAYRDIVAPERVVYDHATRPGDPVDFRAHVLLEEVGPDQTAVTLALVCETAAIRQQKLGAGVRPAMNQTLARLDAQMAVLALDPEPPHPATFSLSRRLGYPVDLVYAVWSDRTHLLNWWGPKGFKVIRADLDLRPGGRFHYGMETGGGQAMWGLFRFRAVESGRRLAFINSFSDRQGGLGRHPMAPDWPQQMLCVVDFTDLGGGATRLDLRSWPVFASDAEAAVFKAGHASMEGGWGGTFAVLEDYLAEVAGG